MLLTQALHESVVIKYTFSQRVILLPKTGCLGTILDDRNIHLRLLNHICPLTEGQTISRVRLSFFIKRIDILRYPLKPRPDSRLLAFPQAQVVAVLLPSACQLSLKNIPFQHTHAIPKRIVPRPASKAFINQLKIPNVEKYHSIPVRRRIFQQRHQPEPESHTAHPSRHRVHKRNFFQLFPVVFLNIKQTKQEKKKQDDCPCHNAEGLHNIFIRLIGYEIRRDKGEQDPPIRFQCVIGKNQLRPVNCDK